jgi:uncharacterized protein
MKILVTGARGLIGSALVPFLAAHGHEVSCVSRSAKDASALRWDPEQGTIDALEGFDAVVHLAGESIAAGRWSARQKARILDSRVKGTRLIAETLARLRRPAQVLLSASAVGYYGDRGDEILREESASGQGFLSEVCRAWEQATEAAEKAGLRVVRFRIGMVLSARGGALAKMLLPFKAGLGGAIGSGRQWMSWIAIDDLIGAIHHCLANASLRGAVNAVAPNPVTNREFTRALGRALGRPTLFPMPAFVARLAFGEMANELLLAGQRVEPVRLLASGYRFQFPALEGALEHALGGKKA